MLYFHRILRLTPLLAIAVLISVTLIKYAGTGPRWPIVMGLLGHHCEVNWWKTLLYVQNYVTPDAMVSSANGSGNGQVSRVVQRKRRFFLMRRSYFQCFGHSWYLAVDMQLFVLSPLFVYLIYRYRTKFMYAFSLTIWLCVGCTIATYINLDYTPIK